MEAAITEAAEADRAALLELGGGARTARGNLQISLPERDAPGLDHAANQSSIGAPRFGLLAAVITCGAWRVLNRAAADDPAATR